MFFQYAMIFMAFIATCLYVGYLIAAKCKNYVAESLCKNAAYFIAIVTCISTTLYFIATWLPDIIEHFIK